MSSLYWNGDFWICCTILKFSKNFDTPHPCPQRLHLPLLESVVGFKFDQILLIHYHFHSNHLTVQKLWSRKCNSWLKWVAMIVQDKCPWWYHSKSMLLQRTFYESSETLLTTFSHFYRMVSNRPSDHQMVLIWQL